MSKAYIRTHAEHFHPIHCNKKSYDPKLVHDIIIVNESQISVQVYNDDTQRFCWWNHQNLFIFNLFSRSLALSSSIYIFGCVCAYIYIKFLNSLLFSDGNMISNFRKNGFTLEEDPHAPPGQHFKLKAVPFSKNITFGVEGSCCFQIFFP